MAKAYVSQMESTVPTECLSEYMTALQLLSYQLVTTSLRLIAEVLGLGQAMGSECNLSREAYLQLGREGTRLLPWNPVP